MPIRRRTSKRRYDVDMEFRIWRCVLDSGYDHFAELCELDVETDEVGRPDLTAAREAWRRFGERVLAERAPGLGPTWAEEQFG